MRIGYIIISPGQNLFGFYIQNIIQPLSLLRRITTQFFKNCFHLLFKNDRRKKKEKELAEQLAGAIRTKRTSNLPQSVYKRPYSCTTCIVDLISS